MAKQKQAHECSNWLVIVFGKKCKYETTLQENLVRHYMYLYLASGVQWKQLLDLANA